MRYGHELTPAEQLQPLTQVVPAEQIQALAAPDSARVGETERLLLTGTYEAENRKANALQEQRGIPNDIARTALGRAFKGAGMVGKENRAAEGRLRGTRPDGSPIFEKVGAQAQRQAAWEARQASASTEAERLNFGPQPPQTEFVPPRPTPGPQPPKVQETRDWTRDPYAADQAENTRDLHAAQAARRQRSDPNSAAPRLGRQPKPRVQEDDVFDDPLGKSRRQY